MQFSQLLLATTVAVAAATSSLALALTDDQPPCAGYSGNDLSGQVLDSHHEAITTLAPKTGSVFIPSGYGVTLYPGLHYVGPGVTVTSVRDDSLPYDSQYYYLTKAVPAGRSINIADLAETTSFAAFPQSGMGSFHCFKLGTSAAPGKTVPVSAFYNGSRFENPAISAHGSDKYATLTNLNGKKLLTFIDASPDNGTLTYVVDLDSGDVTYDQNAVHGLPAIHKVVTGTDARHRDALLTVKAQLDFNFGDAFVGDYPYNAPEESLVEVRRLLANQAYTSPF